MSWMFYRKIAIFLFIVLSYAQTYPQIGSNETLDIVTWNIENFPKNTQTINYLSSAIAVYYSCGKSLKKSCEKAIKYVNQAISYAPEYGKGYGPINHLNSIDLNKKFR